MRAVMLLGLALLGGCAASNDRFADAKGIIAERCAACHVVPGVRTATGHVGPSLTGIGRRQVLAGHLSNSRENMIRWISEPQSILPGDAMPNTGLTRAQAERVADYLYTLDK